MRGILLASVLWRALYAAELHEGNWEDEVEGKTLFVKFFAPWCGHCKALKPDWERLEAEYEGSKSVLIAEVDCTGNGKSKCDSLGVQGYPTLKHGHPDDLKDYRGGRSYEELKQFAQTLGVTCSPFHPEVCSEEKMRRIEEFKAMSEKERAQLIREKEAAIVKLQADFQEYAEVLNKQYQEASDAKEKGVAAVKGEGGLSMLKAVHGHAIREKAKQKSEAAA